MLPAPGSSGGSVSIEARQAALMELRIGDRAALHAHPLPAEGAVCRQQLLVTLAVDDVLARIPRPRDVAPADYRTVLHGNRRSHRLRVGCRGHRDRPSPSWLLMSQSNPAISGASGMSLESRIRYWASQSQLCNRLSSRFRQHRNGKRRTRVTNDQLLCLDDKEEDEATEKKPGPNPERDRLGLEESLKRRCVGKQELKDHDRANPHCQILVAEMALEGQGRIQFVAAVEQVEDLTDHESIHGDRPGELVGRPPGLHPEECPQSECQQCQSDKNNPPDAEGVQYRPVDRARLPLHDIELVR